MTLPASISPVVALQVSISWGGEGKGEERMGGRTGKLGHSNPWPHTKRVLILPCCWGLANDLFLLVRQAELTLGVATVHWLDCAAEGDYRTHFLDLPDL